MNRLKSFYSNPHNLALFALTLGVLILSCFDPAAGGIGGAVLAMAAAAKESTSVRKLTVKAVGAQPDFEKLMEAPNKRMDLADFVGIATKAKPGSSDHGPYVAFLGQFQATNLATKETFTARKCILPKFIEEEMFAAFDAEGNGNVEFAFRLSAKFDKDAATKYVYEMKSIIKPQENAQFAALLGRVKEEVKALPGPKA